MIIAFVTLAVLFAGFVYVNRDPITVKFLVGQYNTTVGLAVVVPLVLGLLVGFGISWGKQQLLRTQLRNAEARTKSAEGKLREIARQTEIADDQQDQEQQQDQ